jgi:hypothetical protein
MLLFVPHPLALAGDFQGDCDSSLECEGDLICVQREESKYRSESDSEFVPVGSMFFVNSCYLYTPLIAR